MEVTRAWLMNKKTPQKEGLKYPDFNKFRFCIDLSVRGHLGVTWFFYKYINIKLRNRI